MADVVGGGDRVADDVGFEVRVKGVMKSKGVGLGDFSVLVFVYLVFF